VSNIFARGSSDLDGAPSVGADSRQAKADGKVKNIGVHAVLEQTGMYMPTANSDDEGRFRINGLEPGAYDVFGESSADSYPDTTVPFYNSAKLDKATLEGEYPSATLVLHLGPRAGVLTGTVMDRATGSAVVSRYNLHFILKQTANPDRSIEVASPPEFRLLVPPGVEVYLDVSAVGYKSWFYADPLNPSEHLPLRLESGQEMPIAITLEPSSKHPATDQ
jgi:hypothetical protein